MSYARSAKSVFFNMLGTLDHLVAKAMNGGVRDDVLAFQLTDDMFNLELQLRVALNQVLLAINQVTKRTVPLEESPYRSLGRSVNASPLSVSRSTGQKRATLRLR